MKISSNYELTHARPQAYPNFKRNWQEHMSWGVRFAKETSKANFKLFTFTDAKMAFVEVAKKAGKSFGSIRDRIVQILAAQGTIYTVNNILPEDDNSKIYPMNNKGNGVFEVQGIETEENAQYRYIIVNKNNRVSIVKDPYAKKQPDINGWSEIYNPDNYQWQAKDWLAGNDPRRIVRDPKKAMRGLENLVIEEINIPTLSKEGSFDKAKAHIDAIAEKGIATAIEIMPVENCFSLQWGYDGVDKFAINEKMGKAEDLKKLIDYAHTKGLNVIMDMVPNHIGPDGNYLTQTGPYVKKAGDFGDVPNYEGKDNRYVRDWMANAALWWINEFKVDGLRLDMTKYCESDYLLKQIVSEVNEHFPMVFMIAEDGRDNKHTVTDYEPYSISHKNALDMIDQSVDNIANKRWHTYPNAIGFDSEWDFPLMHELKDSIIEPYKINLDRLDERIWNSKYRVKYVMSHDEIGNMDGTRLIPKIIASHLNLFNRIEGSSDAEKGQRAAQIGQKIAELYIKNELTTLNENEFQNKLKEIGLTNVEGLNKNSLEEAFNIAFAKQKLAFATVMTLPGPKMYFQGDDSLDLSNFKFFREFSSDKERRAKNPDYIKSIIEEKGYDTLESIARPDSIIGRVEVSNDNDLVKKMSDFTEVLAKTIKENQGLSKGEIIGTFKDIFEKVHIHHIKYNNEEYLVLKNFGTNFHDNIYGFANFPQGNWNEIFNSDASQFGGFNFINSDRPDGSINIGNQRLNLAPNSVVFLKKV